MSGSSRKVQGDEWFEAPRDSYVRWKTKISQSSPIRLITYQVQRPYTSVVRLKLELPAAT